jgi:PKHD-type hydroxylase
MVIYKFPFLAEQDVANILLAIKDLPFVDGQTTAQGDAKPKKNNEQLELNSLSAKTVYEAFTNLFFNHAFIKNLVIPAAIPRVFINRYNKGCYYKSHVDLAFINQKRTDFSFTVSLTKPSEYEGGELQIINDDGKISSFKPELGHIVLYSTGALHQVTEITSGSRMAIVGWVSSAVPSDYDRSLILLSTKINAALNKTPEDLTEISAQAGQLTQMLIRRFSS